MRKSEFKSFLEASGSEHQELINDVHRVARLLLDTKDLLEKVADKLDKSDENLLKAIKNIEDLDVDVEYVVHQLEKM